MNKMTQIMFITFRVAMWKNVRLRVSATVNALQNCISATARENARFGVGI